MGLFDFFKGRSKGAGGAGHAGAPDPRVTRLLELLAHPDAEQRAAACEALGALGSPALVAIDALEEAMTDVDNAVCTAAASALNVLRSAS